MRVGYYQQLCVSYNCILPSYYAYGYAVYPDRDSVVSAAYQTLVGVLVAYLAYPNLVVRS